jgi:hypothetical protein
MRQPDRPAPKKFLQLHRSFRYVAPDAVRMLPPFLLAAGLSVWMAYQGTALISLHEGFRGRILEGIGVPVTGYETLASLGLEGARAAISPMASYQGRPWLLAAVCAMAAAFFLAVYARVKLTRSVVICALAVLAVSAAVTLSQSFTPGDSGFFTVFWLRCEFVIWILTPWLMAILAGIIMPSPWASACWIAAAPAYAVVWSAVRLAFCTGLLYYSGPVLILLLWSIFGLLADLLSLCLFYSLAIYQAGSLRRRAISHG